MSTRPLQRTAAQHQHQHRFDADADDRDVEDARLARLRKGYTWEATQLRSWEQIEEDPYTGRLKSLDKHRQIARKRHRDSDHNASSLSGIRRGVIRYCTLVVDLSAALAANDYKPTRAELLAQAVMQFASHFFDHNPLSQLALVSTRLSDAQRLCSFASAARPVEDAMRQAVRLAPLGNASLQNALRIVQKLAESAPPYALREAIVCFGSLSTCDPGDVHATISALSRDRIRVSAVGLAAELHVLKTLTAKTGGAYVVATDEHHFRQALATHVVPPPASGKQVAASLIRMGFPPLVRMQEAAPFVNNPAARGKVGFQCPRCGAWLSDVPCECTLCGLTLVSSPHLARSYHHLFPVPKFFPIDVTRTSGPVGEDGNNATARVTLPLLSEKNGDNDEDFDGDVPDGVRPTMLALRKRAVIRCTACTVILRRNAVLRVMCPSCLKAFCADCDAFIHESLHQCPGCGLTVSKTYVPTAPSVL